MKLVYICTINRMNKTGICGWLTRDGEFYECGESKHNLLAKSLEKELGLKYFDEERSIYLHDSALLDALGFVKFTQSRYGLKEGTTYNQFVVFFGKRFSYEQRKWMQENIGKMSPEQRLECRNRLMLGY